MTGLQMLQAIANGASIATAIVAVWVWWTLSSDTEEKQRRLEDYLKAEKTASNDAGQRTIMHLVAALGLTEAEILNAAFRSKHIVRRVSPDQYGAASRLFLAYEKNAKSALAPN
jgi:hypothetical protein